MNTILVTGATGRLGANLVRQLLGRGYAIKALVLPEDPNRSKLDGLEIETVVGDLRDADLAPKLVADVDAVIHTANILGPPRGMGRDTFFDINVKGTFHLLHAAAQRADALERFVHVSSDAVYPMGNHDIAPCYNPIDELHPRRPAGLYALTKMINEVTVESYRTSHGLKTTMIRPAGMFAGSEVLGRWTVGFVAGRLRSAANRPSSGLYHPDLERSLERLQSAAESPDQLCVPHGPDGEPWLYSPADARDVAHACICALEHPAAVGEAFNAAVPRPFTFDEVASYLSQRTGASVLEIDLPVRWIYWSDVRKARAMIGYDPQGDLERVFNTALAHQAGEPVDVVPA
jgi:nucleoside-diphosphate-sugar epimerase